MKKKGRQAGIVGASLDFTSGSLGDSRQAQASLAFLGLFSAPVKQEAL